MNLLEKGSDRSTSLSLSAAECHVTADSLLSDLSTSLPPSTAKYNRGWIFKPKAVNAVRVTHCAIPRGWHCGCTHNHRQCGPAYKCSLTRKSAATRASHLVKQLYKWCLHIVHTHLKRHIHTLQQMHTPEMYSESEDKENTDSEDEAHTHFKRHTPEDTQVG